MFSNCSAHCNAGSLSLGTDVPTYFFAAQVVQGASEPGGHQAAGGHGWLCPGVPGTFSQPAGEHADQDQSCW